MTRSYTPVSFKYASEKGSQDITTMVLLVKHYNSGVLSRHITQESFTQSIMLSQPKGGFDLNKLKYHTHFGLLAAGSGITPMLGILEYLLDRSKLKV